MHPIKILILGASNDQVKLIKAAKHLGYYIVDCDFTSTNPGLPLVDKHYKINYLDKEKILEIAKYENVDGIISNSEQAMPIVAYVSEQLSLPGNSARSILKLSDKLQFRKLQKDIGEYCPQYFEVENHVIAGNYIKSMKLPVVLKPCKGSATRGTIKIEKNNANDIESIFARSQHFSWNNRVALEEFVQMPSLTTYEGDVFIVGDDIIWEGMFYTQRSAEAPLIPMTYSGPLNDNDANIDSIKKSLANIFKSAGIKLGEYNVELYPTFKNEIFVIEINTRQGGRNLPEFIQQFSGVDLTKLLVATSVGDYTFYKQIKTRPVTKKYISHHLIFPHQDGTFKNVHIDHKIEGYVIAKEILCKEGDFLNKSENGTDLIGYIDFEFPNQQTRNMYAFNIENYVYVEYQ